MSFCSASAETVSSLSSTMLRSSVAASCLASADAPVSATMAGFTARSGARRGFAADFATALLATVFAARLGDDIKFVPLLHRLVFLQLHLAVRHALAGLHVVFHAVPGADEMHLILGEVEAHRGLVRTQPFLDLGDGQAFAGRTALMQAEIAVGVELAFMPEHADLVVTDKNNAAVAVFHFGEFCDEFLGHPIRPRVLPFILVHFLGSPSPGRLGGPDSRPPSGTLLSQTKAPRDGHNSMPSYARPRDC